MNINKYSIDLICDNELFRFFYICKSKHANLEGWISQNQLFINSSVSDNSQTFRGYTPLHFAVKCYNLIAVQILLKHGADYSLKNAKGQTPLHLGMQMILFNSHRLLHSYFENILKRILDKLLLAHDTKYINSFDNMGISSFHIACFINNPYIITGFLKNGVEINSYINLESQHWAGYTPLHIATSYSSINAIHLLLQHGADINAKNLAGLSPLHCAIKNHNESLVNVLFSALRRESNEVNPTDNVGLSLLHYMVSSGSYMSEQFLQYKSSINSAINITSPLWAGCTPLHVAIQSKHPYMIRVLILHGADINAKNGNDVSPLLLAIHKKLINSSVLHFILSRYNKTGKYLIANEKLFDLFSACMSHEVDVVYNLLNRGININIALPSDYLLDLPGYTPLHFAVESGNAEIVDLLLRHGANVCIQENNNKSSPLHLAFERKNYFIVKKILTFYNNVMDNPTNVKGLSHLHIACIDDKIDVVEKFLQLGLEVNLPTNSGETPLHFAVKFGSEKVVKLLLACNADFTAQAENRLTPLHVAIESEKKSVVEAILLLHSGKIINPVNQKGVSHFHIFCMKNKASLVEAFVKSTKAKSGLGLHLADQTGSTAMHYAVKNGCTETVSVLLQNGSDPIAMDALGKLSLHYATKLGPGAARRMLDILWPALLSHEKRLLATTGLSALHVACLRDDPVEVRSLLETGAEVNAQTSPACATWPGASPLHLTARAGSPETVRLLLERGADPRATDARGFTALHAASARGSLGCVDCLLEAGADAAACAVRGLTPLRLALQAGASQVAHALLAAARGNPVDNKGLSYLHVACLRGEEALAERLLDVGADASEAARLWAAPRLAGATPLHLAVRRRSTGLLEMLLAHGADPRASDVWGRSPLHLTCHAARTANARLARRLLAHGADPRAPDVHGDSLLHLAVRHGQRAILLAALHHGADPNLPAGCPDDCHPIELAILSRRPSILEALLDHGADATLTLPDGTTFAHRTIMNVQADEEYYVEVLNLLSVHGCDLDAPDVSGKAAVHRACWPHNPAAVRALLRCGADMDVEDWQGRTVVNYLLGLSTSRMPGRLALYRFLRDLLEARCLAGLGPSARNRAALEELHEACQDFLDDEVMAVAAEEEEVHRHRARCLAELGARCGRASVRRLLGDTRALAWALGSLGDLLVPGVLEARFPVTAPLLRMQCIRARRRRALLGPALEALDVLLASRVPMWLEACSRIVLDHLDDEDLRSLVAACTPQSSCL